MLLAAAVLVVPIPLPAQTSPGAARQGEVPEYKPPPRGAPGGRVGGASRGTYKPAFPLPTIDAVAPQQQSGLSESTSPVLYFIVSGPVYWPTHFTISAPLQPAPIVAVNIAPPRDAGVYFVRLSDLGVQLKPGIVYTWSVAAILDPNARSRDILASASLLLAAPDPALENAIRNAPLVRRAPLWAQTGFWYDAVAAAVAASPYDRGTALAALIKQVGLAAPGTTVRPAAALGSSVSNR
jgi:hypothetical protein